MREQNVTRDGSSDDCNESSTEPMDAGSIADRRLPPEIGSNLQALFGTEDRPETFGAWIDALAAALNDVWPPAIADLCHDDEGRHRAETEDGTYRFVCVLDAVILPFLIDGPVEVHSEGPETGAVVTSNVSQTGIEISPGDAVLSFGVAPVEPDAELTAQLTYETLCPYVHAFPDRDAYERWSEGIDAPTTALELSDGFALARAMARA